MIDFLKAAGLFNTFSDRYNRNIPCNDVTNSSFDVISCHILMSYDEKLINNPGAFYFRES